AGRAGRLPGRGRVVACAVAATEFPPPVHAGPDGGSSHGVAARTVRAVARGCRGRSGPGADPDWRVPTAVDCAPARTAPDSQTAPRNARRRPGREIRYALLAAARRQRSAAGPVAGARPVP